MSTHPERGLTRRGLAGILGLGVLDLLMPGRALAQESTLLAEGGEPPFRVYGRDEWGARRPARTARVISRPPDRIVVHHTATANTKDRSLAQAFRLSREIQRFHMRERGWDDTGQQLTISRGGYVMEGRNRSLEAIRAGRHAVGAQTLHHNRHTIGIENEGTYSRAPVPSRLWDSLIDTCAWLCTAYDLDPFRAIVGHRDLFATDCPGDIMYARLTELRTRVALRLDGGSDKEAAEAVPPSTKSDAPAPSASSPSSSASPSPSEPARPPASPSSSPSPRTSVTPPRENPLPPDVGAPG
ncbi:peptidoglycan recognition family protein [Spirillospora sp. NPDC029432]|uniref:peptidoglycan recognition protein family protein n=1 Tax=Spirillospora sp. NPDC029432 TaxID=3154599 RepID=UPI003456B091